MGDNCVGGMRLVAGYGWRYGRGSGVVVVVGVEIYVVWGLWWEEGEVEVV